MRHRFHDLFLVDRPARIRMYGSAWLVSTAVGTMLALVGTSVEQSVMASAFLVLAIVVARTVVYCFVPHRVPSTATTAVGRRAAFAGLTSGLFGAAVILGLTTGRMEAAAVNQRLRKYLKKEPISQSEIDAIGDALDLARNNRIRVADSVINDVGTRLSNITSNSALPTVVRAAHQGVEKAAALRSTLGSPGRIGTRYVPVQRFPTYSLFEQCFIHDYRFALDTNAFVDSSIRDCMVVYEGGPVVLKNTEFIRCEFQFSELAAARELLLLLSQKNDPDFAFRENEIPSSVRIKPPSPPA